MWVRFNILKRVSLKAHNINKRIRLIYNLTLLWYIYVHLSVLEQTR